MIEPGTTLARYRVESKLGEGGMGVVWKATDTTLHRAVALKVLPEAFARDPERVARFEREARVLASLNHPNIAAIYGLESDGPLRVLAMEYVPGETLSERLARGAVPVPEALQVAQRIAEALESAHERGVVHRDLKPQNIQLTPEGDVKVLDFGLARALAPDGAPPSLPDESPTISAVMTRGDVILGTAAYMSPEQARGRLVDRRSDIWSFGLVVFEMLTGKRVFEGETTTDLLAAVLRQDIPWERLPAATPPHVRALLERCLERDPKQRLRDIGEARIALASSPSEGSASGRRTWLRWAALIPLLAIAIAATWFVARRPGAPEGGAVGRFEIAALADPLGAGPAISPDGKAVAFVDQGQLWLRELGRVGARSLITDGDASNPFWSPDSKSIGFLSGPRVMRVSAAGGTAETLAQFPVGFGLGLGGEGGTWDERGHVIITQGMASGLVEIPEHGGEPHTVFPADTARFSDFHEPALLPGSGGILVVAHGKKGVDNVSLVREGKLTTLLTLPGQTVRRPQYSATGHIVFERSTPPAGIWAVPFSLAELRTTGEPFLVVPGGFGGSVAPDGSLAYVSPTSQSFEFCWVDREGAVLEHVVQLAPSTGQGGSFDLSPDGTHVVTTVGPEVDVWDFDLMRGIHSQLTSSSGMEVSATWSADGTQVLYESVPDLAGSELSNWSILRQNADGSGLPDTLVKGGAFTPAVSKDGRTLYYTMVTGQESWTIQSRPFGTQGAPASLTDGRHVAYFPRPSPDGRWIAYNQNDKVPNGRPQVQLLSLASGTRTLVGTGLWPKWNERGDRLFFVHRDDIMEVKIGQGDPPIIGPPTRLFTRPRIDLAMVFDWTPQFGVKGDRFLILRPIDEQRPTSIVLVQNWLEEFRKEASSKVIR